MTTTPDLYLANAEKDQLKINNVTRQLIEGRAKVVGTFSLSSTAGATTITSQFIGPNSVIFWQPATASAAAQMDNMYVSTIGQGTLTLAHTSSGGTDQTFRFVAVG